MSSIIKNNAIFIDFNKDYCHDSGQLLNSALFTKVLRSYIQYLNNNRDLWWWEFIVFFPYKEDEFVREFIYLFKMFIHFKYGEIQHDFLAHRKTLEVFVEGLYDYWRKFERYSLLLKSNAKEGIDDTTFIDSENDFHALILKTYRKISKTIIGEGYKVYRQLIAGSNVGVIAANLYVPLPTPYLFLKNIRVITTIILHIPFIIYPKNTKRDGIFKEASPDILAHLSVKENAWFCFPIMVGDLLALVYASDEYMNILIALGNLFAPAKESVYQKRKPDIIYIYGEESCVVSEPVFIHDTENDIYVGVAPKCEEITYFGYLKKMLLTLHNLKKINQKLLPIHGAMASLIFKDGSKKNIVLMGDSGAGKSETLEALRILGGKKISRTKIIFDDMGYLKIKDNQIYGYGTEIGAFVRIDDLDNGYAYEHMDRAIFINPDKSNARLLIPVSPYQDIVRGEKVDMFFYANNYDNQYGLRFFKESEQAKKVFIQGQRIAKKTTTETGLVSSYFANPFGMIQWKDKSEKVIDRYFAKFYEAKLPVGEIYTRLGLDEGLEGPLTAAKALLDYLKKE